MNNTEPDNWSSTDEQHNQKIRELVLFRLQPEAEWEAWFHKVQASASVQQKPSASMQPVNSMSHPDTPYQGPSPMNSSDGEFSSPKYSDNDEATFMHTPDTPCCDDVYTSSSCEFSPPKYSDNDEASSMRTPDTPCCDDVYTSSSCDFSSPRYSENESPTVENQRFQQWLDEIEGGQKTHVSVCSTNSDCVETGFGLSPKAGDKRDHYTPEFSPLAKIIRNDSNSSSGSSCVIVRVTHVDDPVDSLDVTSPQASDSVTPVDVPVDVISPQTPELSWREVSQRDINHAYELHAQQRQFEIENGIINEERGTEPMAPHHHLQWGEENFYFEEYTSKRNVAKADEQKHREAPWVNNPELQQAMACGDKRKVEKLLKIDEQKQAKERAVRERKFAEEACKEAVVEQARRNASRVNH